MEGVAQVVVQAVHSIWEDWSHESRAFGSERPEMHGAFGDLLCDRLPWGWSVASESRLPLPRQYSAWSRYDIGVLQGSQLTGLLELSLGDTNVGHALHNGELKLLGICDGVGVSTGKPYSAERGLVADDIAMVGGEISKVPVRGLFFVNPGPRAVLDRPEKAMWRETKPKKLRRRDAILVGDDGARNESDTSTCILPPH